LRARGQPGDDDGEVPGLGRRRILAAGGEPAGHQQRHGHQAACAAASVIYRFAHDV